MHFCMIKGLARLIIVGTLCVFFAEELSGVLFTTEPPNPFVTLERGNGSLEWRYTFGKESFRQVTFGNTKIPRIVEFSKGDTTPWIEPLYCGRLRVKISNNYTSITFVGVNRTDSGTHHLTVIANPSRRSKTSHLELSVHYLYRPNIHMGSSTPLEGNHVTLSCNVDAKPEPNVSWTRNGFPINTIENARISISGHQKRMEYKEILKY